MRPNLLKILVLIAVVVGVFFMGPAASVRADRAADWATMFEGASRDLPTPVTPVATSAPGVLVVDLVDGATDSQLDELEVRVGATVDLAWLSDLTRDEALATGEVPNMREALANLAGDPLVEVAEPEILLQAFSFPNDPMFEQQWNLRAMGAPAGWELTPMGDGVVVAVIDTGVAQVEDLKQTKVLEGASFVSGEPSWVDENGHGTHVAGTIAQSTHNGVGVAGVAPMATILPIKVLSKHGFGSSSSIAAGIDHAVDGGADVINMSLGGAYSAVVHNAVRKAREAGVIVVAAAGNSGRRGVSYPGGLAESIGVSALGPDGQLAPYSSFGKGVDIAAPGGDKSKAGGGILQDTVDGAGHAYKEFQGTSMAAPHVAGAAAVLLSSGMPAEEVQSVLLSSASGDSVNERTGHGALNLESALGMSGELGEPVRFAFGAFVALWIAGLARSRRVPFPWVASLCGGAAAGGLFMLGGLLPMGTASTLLTTAFLHWPGVLFGYFWIGFPLWLSALVPLMVCFVGGPIRLLRPLALGFSAGVGAHLFWGAATLTLSPWLMSPITGTLWLCANGTLCLVLALALAGIEKLASNEEPRS